MEIFSKLGIDWRLFLAQIVNFFILLYVLRRFVYVPMARFLEARRKKIEDGLEHAEKSEEMHRVVKVEVERIVLQAKREAKVIVDEAHQQAKEVHKTFLEQAHTDAHEILHKAKKQSEEERQAYIERFQVEIAELVVLAAEKVVGKKWDAQEDRKLVEEIVGGMTKK